MIPLIIYIVIFVAAFFIVTKVVQGAGIGDYTSLKTVTFGDESAVRPNRAAGIISVLTIFVMWGIFTGSSLLPGFLHAPGPFEGTTTFTYTAQVDGQAPDDAEVTVIVHPREVDTDASEVEPGDATTAMPPPLERDATAAFSVSGARKRGVPEPTRFMPEPFTCTRAETLCKKGILPSSL